MLRVAARIAFSTLLLLAPISAARATLYSIVGPVFCSYVTEDGNYTPVNPFVEGIASRSKLEHNRIYFVFTVIGGENTIKYLKDNKRLEVKVVIFVDNQKRDTIDVGITQEKWKNIGRRLVDEFEQKGYFTYRTYMDTGMIHASTIEVRVIDARHSHVRLVDAPVSYSGAINIVP